MIWHNMVSTCGFLLLEAHQVSKTLYLVVLRFTLLRRARSDFLTMIWFRAALGARCPALRPI